MQHTHLTALLLLTIFFTACDDREVGPPAKLSLETVKEAGNQTAILQATVWDEKDYIIRATGELTWEFVESTGKEKLPRCKLTVPLQDSDFKDETKDHGEFFEVRFKLDKPCKPLTFSDSFTYGFISLRLPDGRVIRDEKFAWTPRAYGGKGEMEFPDQEAAVREARKEYAGKNAAIEKLFADLGRVATARPDAKLAPGVPCPADLAAEGRVLKADHRVLAALPAAHKNKTKVKLPIPIGTPAFEATNDPHIGDLVKFQNGDRKLYEDIARLAQQPRSHMLVVDVEKILEPESYSSEKFETGFFSGEVWVVEIASAKVLCRARATATNSESLKATKAGVYNAVDLDFISQVSSAMYKARQKVAPGLVPLQKKPQPAP